jgi:hypothetical protein
MIVLVSAIVELKLKCKINRHIGAVSESIPWLSDGLAISQLNNIQSIKGFACVAGSAFALNSCWLHSAGRSSPACAGSNAPAAVDLEHCWPEERRLTDVMGRRMAPIMRADPEGCEMSNLPPRRCSVMSIRYTIQAQIRGDGGEIDR